MEGVLADAILARRWQSEGNGQRIAGCPGAINVINVGDLKSGTWTLYVWEEIFSMIPGAQKGLRSRLTKV
ncbi:hypothetical protein AX761_07890 [Rhizobium sp. 58]|nr:hypothetical protein AX761_07890 [Rhizobium sp. 58]